MSNIINIELNIQEKFFDLFRRGLIDKIEHPSDDVMYKIHEYLAEVFKPYVPTNETPTEDEAAHSLGHLVDRVEISAEKIVYPGPYAHYVYEGIIYGPNIPIFDSAGNIVAWRSPKDSKKHPTGYAMDYTNPQATRLWDRVALAEHREEIEKRIRDIIVEAWRNERR